MSTKRMDKAGPSAARSIRVAFSNSRPPGDRWYHRPRLCRPAACADRREGRVPGARLRHRRAPRSRQLNRGESYIKHIPSERVAEVREPRTLRGDRRFRPPRRARRDPDLRADAAHAAPRAGPLLSSRRPARAIAPRLRQGQLIVLESTTYPGTTDEVLKPILEATGLKSGTRLLPGLLARARGSRQHRISAPRRSRRWSAATGRTRSPSPMRSTASSSCRTVPVSSAATAEAVKLTENIFRAVNIALVNELKVVYAAMGIDVWEVIDAAKTKPFGFMPFYPGPGLGGHCIPIDPFYLTWKAREYDITTRFIELAGEINTAHAALRRRHGSPKRSTAVGRAASRRADPDPRPRLQEERRRHAREPVAQAHRADRGARRAGRLPRSYIPVIPTTREHAPLAGRRSVDA